MMKQSAGLCAADRRSAVRRALLALGGAAMALGGCAQLAPSRLPAGAPISEARGAFVKPSGEYPLPGGGTRLEYSQGSYGRETYMLDFDASGRLVTSQQVLTEPNFATITRGMPEDELRMRLGRPAQVFNIGWQHQQVWNYRYAGGDCVWFQVSIDEQTRRVADAGIGQDPACDVSTRD